VNGILLVDKPEGMTSAGVVRLLKRPLEPAKIGHLGTLDPFASGLLPLCVGEATKVARYLLLEDKAYTGRIRLGAETDTLDRTGAVTARAPVPELTQSAVDEVAARFRGPQRQTPPMYSALKRDGVPLYKLARKGMEVEREAREVVIHALALRLVAPDALDFEVRCSKGTYVRVLAADLGLALGTVAHLEELRRTQVGTFRVEDARAPEALRGEPLSSWPVIGIPQALAGLRRFTLSGPDVATLRRGQQGPLGALPKGEAGEAALVLTQEGAVAAVIEVADADRGWRMVRVLAAG